MLNDRSQLYRVSAKVRPLPWHPIYYDWQFGFLSLWLFANSVEDARERALLIAGALPYELAGEELSVETGFPQTEESRAMHDGAQAKAEKIGLAIRVYAVETGADEAEFEAASLW